MITVEVSVSKLEQEAARLSKMVDSGGRVSAQMAAGALSVIHWIRHGGDKPSDVLAVVDRPLPN